MLWLNLNPAKKFEDVLEVVCISLGTVAAIAGTGGACIRSGAELTEAKYNLEGLAAAKEMARDECSMDGLRCSSDSDRRSLMSSERSDKGGSKMACFASVFGSGMDARAVDVEADIGSGSTAELETGLVEFIMGGAFSALTAVVEMISPTSKSMASNFCFRITAGSLLSAASTLISACTTGSGRRTVPFKTSSIPLQYCQCSQNTRLTRRDSRHPPLFSRIVCILLPPPFIPDAVPDPFLIHD